MTIRRMRIACWTTEATDTHTEYVVIVFPLQQRLHASASVLLYTYITSIISTLLQHELLLQCLPP
jgi:hypothetical protein